MVAGELFIFPMAEESLLTRTAKVRIKGGTFVKLQTTQVGHRLQEAIYKILGESALLEFAHSSAGN